MLPFLQTVYQSINKLYITIQEVFCSINTCHGLLLPDKTREKQVVLEVHKITGHS